MARLRYEVAYGSDNRFVFATGRERAVAHEGTTFRQELVDEIWEIVRNHGWSPDINREGVHTEIQNLVKNWKSMDGFITTFRLLVQLAEKNSKGGGGGGGAILPSAPGKVASHSLCDANVLEIRRAKSGAPAGIFAGRPAGILPWPEFGLAGIRPAGVWPEFYFLAGNAAPAGRRFPSTGRRVAGISFQGRRPARAGRRFPFHWPACGRRRMGQTLGRRLLPAWPASPASWPAAGRRSSPPPDSTPEVP